MDTLHVVTYIARRIIIVTKTSPITTSTVLFHIRQAILFKFQEKIFDEKSIFGLLKRELFFLIHASDELRTM